jgi:hypothetical protein
MKLPLSIVLSFALVACGEKEPETTTEDYSAYCGESPDNNLIADDADCDGTLTADDCDDNDAASLTTAEDGDCDGTLTADDCDDTDAGSTIMAEDGDCDGTLTADDCDDDDASSTIIAEDGDCDGTLSADDCDDADASSTIIAEDADCDGALTADDCDDNNPYAYPGSGANEVNQAEGLCYTDADGDGYADAGTVAGSVDVSCYLLEMTDSFGDGWDGNSIEVFEDGVSTGTYANEDLDDSNGRETQTVQHCLDSATASVEFVFNDGSWDSEVEFNLYYDDGLDGVWIGYGEGDGSNNFVWEDTTTADGEVFYTETAPLPAVDIYGIDCDDSDATLSPGIDGDSDGFSVCDDCDDANVDINPAAEEEYYDGIDADCDGMSDYDMDMDGYDSSEYLGDCSDTTLMNQWDCEEAGTCSDTQYTDQWDCEDAAETWTSAGNTWTAIGDDCDDDDEDVHPLLNEADPTACYEDDDGDGWGDADPWNDAAVAGTDCYDSAYTSASPYTYPGAAYNESDIDGDGVDDCTTDMDEDGYGDSDAYYADVDGTDCDDDDAAINPSVDGDGDNVDACNDCDDTDSSLQGGFGYWDGDADGYGDQDDDGMLMCDFTVDSDSDGVPDYSTNNDDCDDDDDMMSPGYDGDGDGYATCADANGLVDCDDSDEFTFPGAGFNEAGYVAGDYSTYECLTDADEDGYAFGESLACYTFALTDSFGDGWNGGMNLEVFADGVSAGTATVHASWDGGNGDDEETTICVDDGAAVTLVFNDDSWASEIGGEIFGTDGSSLGTISGTGGGSFQTQSITFDGMDYFDGETFFSETAVANIVGGTDSDDSDASVH